MCQVSSTIRLKYWTYLTLNHHLLKLSARQCNISNKDEEHKDMFRIFILIHLNNAGCEIVKNCQIVNDNRGTNVCSLKCLCDNNGCRTTQFAILSSERFLVDSVDICEMSVLFLIRICVLLIYIHTNMYVSYWPFKQKIINEFPIFQQPRKLMGVGGG